MWKKRIPAYLTLFTFVVGALLGMLAMTSGVRHKPVRHEAAPVNSPARPQAADRVDPGEYRFERRAGFTFTRPLLYGEPVRPAARMAPLADTLERIIARHRSDGDIQSASVYVREFRRGEWTQVNGNEVYDPGSVLKIPVLISYLQHERERLGFLEQQVVVPPPRQGQPKPRYEGPHALPGQTYSVRQLLELMIVHSDNAATAVLNSGLDPQRFQAIFTELGLPLPDLNAHRYPLSCRDLSVFLKTLYNSTYLDPAISEQALALMARCTWDKGLRRGVPGKVPIAHKFGESGQEGAYQLHDAGIVYAPGHTYLITVMTRGREDPRLEQVIGELSKATYDWFLADASDSGR